MSRTRTGWRASPPTTMAPKSSRVLMAPSLRTSSTSSPSARRPAPSLRLLAVTAAPSCARLMPAALMRALSGSIS
jgi:hypothetical protein